MSYLAILLLIQLRELARENFQVHLPLLRLFEHSTLGAIVVAVQNFSPGEANKIDWEIEIEVPSKYLKLNINECQCEAIALIGSNVLSGFIGFLGDYLVFSGS